jgi:ABC-2 type transport system permease protein
MKSLSHIYRLGLKELISLRYDYILLILIFYSFTFQVIIPAKGTSTHLTNASIAVVNEDRSPLSYRIVDSLQQPFFKKPRNLRIDEIDLAMDRGLYTFVIDIPPDFQSRLLSGRKPEIQINIDATAIGQARTGTTYLKKIISREIDNFVKGYTKTEASPVILVMRIKYNPNLQNSNFTGLLMLIFMITMLAILLPGAAFLREKEHGTVEHLLVMPLRPMEIVFAKLWANSLVVVAGTMLSLILIVQIYLGAPQRGSLILFFFGTLVYLFSTIGLGIFLATVSQNAPQMGLLSLPVITPIVMLSGGLTPKEAMPEALQYLMALSPTGHYLDFATAIIFREAGIAVVWPKLLVIAVIGIFIFIFSIKRFRATFK